MQVPDPRPRVVIVDPDAFLRSRCRRQQGNAVDHDGDVGHVLRGLCVDQHLRGIGAVHVGQRHRAAEREQCRQCQQRRRQQPFNAPARRTEEVAQVERGDHIRRQQNVQREPGHLLAGIHVEGPRHDGPPQEEVDQQRARLRDEQHNAAGDHQQRQPIVRALGEGRPDEQGQRREEHEGRAAEQGEPRAPLQEIVDQAGGTEDDRDLLVERDDQEVVVPGLSATLDSLLQPPIREAAGKEVGVVVDRFPLGIGGRLRVGTVDEAPLPGIAKRPEEHERDGGDDSETVPPGAPGRPAEGGQQRRQVGAGEGAQRGHRHAVPHLAPLTEPARGRQELVGVGDGEHAGDETNRNDDGEVDALEGSPGKRQTRCGHVEPAMSSRPPARVQPADEPDEDHGGPQREVDVFA